MDGVGGEGDTHGGDDTGGLMMTKGNAMGGDTQDDNVGQCDTEGDTHNDVGRGHSVMRDTNSHIDVERGTQAGDMGRGTHVGDTGGGHVDVMGGDTLVMWEGTSTVTWERDTHTGAMGRGTR